MIELKNITRTYITGKSEVNALRGVSLNINMGEFVAIMGHSGSGKSTLLSILGFLDKPDSGSYSIMGRETSGLTDDELSVLRNNICGFVFQQFHLMPRMTVRDNVSLPLIYSGLNEKMTFVDEHIRSVGLAHRIDHMANELSGGEQQRVAIARSMSNDPLILFADEPTGNLDSKTEKDILAILTSLHEQGKTIIMVTHEEEIAHYAERVIYMKDGEIISDGPSSKRKKPTNGYVRDKHVPLFETNRSAMTLGALKDSIVQALTSITTHKMRSFLSMVGILFGVASVIAMLAIGEGAKEAVAEDLKSMGSNMLSVRPGAMHARGVSLEAGTVTRFTQRDSDIIGRLPEIENATPGVNGSAQLVYGNKNWSSMVMGVNEEYEPINSATPIAGRFFNKEENSARRKVALLGTTVTKELFGKENPIGKMIKINKINFRVIGVLPKKGSSPFRDRDDVVVVPINTAMYRVLGVRYVDYIDVKVKSPDLIDSAIKSISSLVKKEHRFSDDDSFQIRDMTELRTALQGTTRTMGLLLGIVAAISLIVGGIGIMNIMLVTVKERTREIGVRRAIGAFRRDIMSQFLTESALLTVSGGLGGIIFGILISYILSAAAGWAIEITPFSIALSTSFSVFIGIVFGFWPAYQASMLKPVEALRQD